MKITNLKSKGLKSGDFDHALEAVNVVCGKNWSGKSSRLEAIRLGLLGYIPELGKTTNATLELARDGEIKIQMLLDNGTTLSRRFWKERSAKQESDIPEELAVPPVLLDPRVYFDLSDKERMRYVFGSLQLDSKFSGESVSAAVQGMTVEAPNEATEKARRELVRWLDQSDRVRHDAQQTVQELLDQIIKEAREKLKSAKAAADRMGKTVQGLTVIQEPTEEVLEDLKVEIEKQANALAAINAALVAAKIQRQIAEQDRATVVRLKAEVAAAAEIESDVATLRKDLETIAVPEPVTLTAPPTTAREALHEIQAKIAALQNEAQGLNQVPPPAEVPEWESKRRSAQAAFELYTRQKTELRVESKANLKHDACPTCHAPGEVWRLHYQGYVDKKLAALDVQIQSAKRDWEKAGKSAEKAMTAWTEKTNARLTEIDKERKRLIGIELPVAEEADAAAMAAYQQAREDHARYIQAISDRESIQRRLADLDAGLAKSRAATSKLETFDDVEGRLEKAQADLAKLKVEAQECKEKLDGLNQQQARFIAARQQAKIDAKVILEAEAAQAEVAVLKGAVAVLEEIQDEIVTESFGTLLMRANEVTRDFMPWKLAYKNGEIGRWNGAQWIGHRTFSGSEQSVTFAAISVALAQDSPLKIILMDELGRLDNEHLGILLETMGRLVQSGIVDQFIGCTSGSAADLPENVNVIQL